jgi:hypothetical protein
VDLYIHSPMRLHGVVLNSLVGDLFRFSQQINASVDPVPSQCRKWLLLSIFRLLEEHNSSGAFIEKQDVHKIIELALLKPINKI